MSTPTDPTERPVSHETPGAYAGTKNATDRVTALVERMTDASDVMVRKADLRELLGLAASAPQGDTLREVAIEFADGMAQIAVALGMDVEAGEVGPIVERVQALVQQGDTADVIERAVESGDRPRFWWSPSQALIRGGSRDTVPADAVELVPRTALASAPVPAGDEAAPKHPVEMVTIPKSHLDRMKADLDRWQPRADDEAAQHVIEFRENGWTIMHPLSCRPALFDCPVNRAAEDQLDQQPDVLGRFVVELQDGELVVGEPADESTRAALAALKEEQQA